MSAELQAVVDAAQVLVQQGRLDEALARYRQAEARWPDQPGLLYNLAALHTQRQEHVNAAQVLERVVQRAPGFSWAHHNLGQALAQIGQAGRAQAAWGEALRIEPGLVASRIALARSQVSEGAAQEAAALLRKGLALLGPHASLLVELGNALRACGEGNSAIASYEQALRLAPDSFAACHNLAATLHAAGATEQALPIAQRAVALRPEAAVALEGLADIQAHLGELESARTRYATALHLDRGARAGLAVRAALLLPPVARSVEAIRSARERFRDGLHRLAQGGGRIGDPIAEVGIVTQFYLAYHGLNNRELLEDLAAMYRQLCPALTWTAPHCRDPQRRPGRIRVGLFSAYLREHTVGRYLLGLVRHLPRERVELCVFSLGAPQDHVARSFHEGADRHEILRGGLDQMRRQIAAAGLDVLIYGDIGMEPVSYFLSFARLAPTQAVFFGHPDTSGVDTVDHFVSWQAAESDGSADWYSERLALLSSSVNYAHVPRPTRPASVASRGELGLSGDGPLFLCVQSAFKIHPDFDGLVAAVLERSPRATVALVGSSMQRWTEILQERLRDRLGTAARRLLFLPERPYDDYLKLVCAADVVLDTPHFSGGATTLDAIAMGTPMVTLGGPSLRAAQTRALLERAGAGACAAADPQDYVERALDIASDRAMRAALATRLQAGSGRVFDDLGMVREMEALILAWTQTPPA